MNNQTNPRAALWRLLLAATLLLASAGCAGFQNPSSVEYVRTAAAVADGVVAALYRVQHDRCMAVDDYSLCMLPIEAAAVAVITFHAAAAGAATWCVAETAIDAAGDLSVLGSAGREAALALTALQKFAGEKCDAVG